MREVVLAYNKNSRKWSQLALMETQLPYVFSSPISVWSQESLHNFLTFFFNTTLKYWAPVQQWKVMNYFNFGLLMKTERMQNKRKKMHLENIKDRL